MTLDREELKLQDLDIIAKGRSSEVFAYNDGMVLKLFNHGLAMNYVESEAIFVRVLHDRGLPVPRVIRLIQVDQRWGIVYEKIDGVSMLESYLGDFSRIEQNSYLMADLHWQIHKISGNSFPTLKTRLYDKICDIKELPKYQKNLILRVLDDLLDGNQLCHMDFHPDQILLTDRGPYILDWETACKGNPLADVARTSILIQVGQVSALSHVSTEQLTSIRSSIRSAYLSRYLKKVAKNVIREIECWEAVVAAARMAENICNEKCALTSIIEDKIPILISTLEAS